MCCYPRYEDDKLNKEPNTEFVILLSASWSIILSYKEKVANLDEVENRKARGNKLEYFVEFKLFLLHKLGNYCC